MGVFDHCGFSVLAIFYIGFSVFALNNWVFYFGVCISLRVFVFLAVGFRFAEEMPAIFRILYPIRFFWNGNCSFEDFSISSNVRTDKLVQILGLNLVQMVEKFRIGILNLGINRLY